MMRTSVLACAAVLAACLDDPSTTNPLSIAATSTSVAADGVSLVTVQVSAMTDSDVILTASTGTFVDAPAPAPGAPATKTVKTARGSTSVSYRAGLDAGTAVITASSGAFAASTNIAMTASLPTQIVLTPNRTSVTGDGVSFVELTTDVIAVRPALVSHGTALQYGVCCVSVDGLPTDCAAGAAPLFLPSIERVDDGQRVVVRALTVQTLVPRSAMVLVRLAAPSIVGSLCASEKSEEVRSNAIAITVTP